MRVPRRARQKSLSEALRTIHERRGSVTENAHELAEALKAPVSLKLIVSLRDEVLAERVEQYTDHLSYCVRSGT